MVVAYLTVNCIFTDLDPITWKFSVNSLFCLKNLYLTCLQVFSNPAFLEYKLILTVNTTKDDEMNKFELHNNFDTKMKINVPYLWQKQYLF